MVSGDKNVHELPRSSVRWLICIFIKTNIFILEGAQGWRPVFCALHLLASAGGTRPASWAADLRCQERAHAEYEMLCHPGGGLDLLPIEDQKWKRKHLPICFILYLLPPPPFYLCPPIPPPSPFHQPTPPPTLTLACLSGLLPCIPPFPVWPLSQEVAQLVDKHHGSGEEGLDSPRPLRLCQ